MTLHDRLAPGMRAKIDHVAVAPAGVWVINAKGYAGQVRRKDVGGLFSKEVHLWVGRRDCTKVLDAMADQVTAVRRALGSEWAEVPVRPMLCLVDAEWGLVAKPFALRGVLVTWPKVAQQLVARPGQFDRATVETIAVALHRVLSPAASSSPILGAPAPWGPSMGGAAAKRTSDDTR